MKKRVFASKVIVQGDKSFEEILRNCLHPVIHLRGKDVELSHISETPQFITSMFVSTQTSDIAPIHTPGDENDYSAVQLQDGQGFAYPNVIAYVKSMNVLLWEVNRSGQSEAGMTEYFNSISRIHYNSSFNVTLVPLMNFDPQFRINRLTEISQVEIQIASPTNYINRIAQEGAYNDIIKLAEDTNPTRSIYIKLSAEKNDINKLSIAGIRNMVSGFMGREVQDTGKTKSKLVVFGKYTQDDNLIDDCINVIMDRFDSNITLPRVGIAENLQIEQRKEQILIIAVSSQIRISELI